MKKAQQSPRGRDNALFFYCNSKRKIAINDTQPKMSVYKSYRTDDVSVATKDE